MPKAIVIHDTHTGTLERMAVVIAAGIRENGVDAIVERAEAVDVKTLAKFDAILIGSPCYFGGPTAAIKKLIDATVSVRGELDGKVGAAFVAASHIGGGSEFTLRSILDAMLMHGMVVQGDPDNFHFGPIAINPSGDPAEVVVDENDECRRLGARVAALVKRVM